MGDVTHSLTEGSLLITASKEQPQIRIWNLEDEQSPDIPRFELPLDTKTCLNPAVDLDGRYVIVRASDHSDVIIYNVNFTQSVTRLRAHLKGVTGLGCYTHKHTSYGITTGNDGSFKVWNLFNGVLVKEFRVDKSVTNVVVDATNQLSLVGFESGDFVIFDLIREEILMRFSIGTTDVHIHFDNFKAVLLTKAGHVYYLCFEQKNVQIKGAIKLLPISSSAFDSKTEMVAVTNGSDVEMRSVRDLTKTAEMTSLTSQVVCMAFHHTNHEQLLVLGDSFRQLRLFRTDGNSLIPILSQYMYGDIMSIISYQNRIMVTSSLGYLGVFNVHLPSSNQKQRNSSKSDLDLDLVDDEELCEFVSIRRKAPWYSSKLSFGPRKVNKVGPYSVIRRESIISRRLCNICSECCIL